MTLPESAKSGAPLLGQQESRLNVVPPYISSAGTEALEVAELAGVDLDPWQQATLLDGLGERPDGRWSAFQVGLCVTRQNGKGGALEIRELTGLFALGEKLVIHSAHEQQTATDHFERVLRLIEGVPEFDQRVLKAPRGKGSEAIHLRGGQKILFKTRGGSGGSGRGLSGNLVVLDEAMILKASIMADLVPIMAAQSVTGNPQLWLTGSAVDQQVHEHGLVFAQLRARALAGVARLMWREHSIEGDDPSAVPEEVAANPESWAESNPGFGYRISEEYVADERAALSARSFAVERLGVGDWPDPSPDGEWVVDQEAWEGKCADRASEPAGPVAYAFDVRPDRSKACIAAAGYRSDGLPHAEVGDHRDGTGWLVDRIVELDQRGGHHGFACDGTGPAVSFVPDLKERGVNVKVLSASEYAQACGAFVDVVKDRRFRHLDTPELNAAVKVATKRPLGEQFAWSRKKSSGDISPLVACTIAVRALETDVGISAYEDSELTIA